MMHLTFDPALLKLNVRLKVLELKPETPDSEIHRAIRFARKEFL